MLPTLQPLDSERQQAGMSGRCPSVAPMVGVLPQEGEFLVDTPLFNLSGDTDRWIRHQILCPDSLGSQNLVIYS